MTRQLGDFFNGAAIKENEDSELIMVLDDPRVLNAVLKKTPPTPNVEKMLQKRNFVLAEYVLVLDALMWHIRTLVAKNGSQIERDAEKHAQEIWVELYKSIVEAENQAFAKLKTLDEDTKTHVLPMVEHMKSQNKVMVEQIWQVLNRIERIEALNVQSAGGKAKPGGKAGGDASCTSSGVSSESARGADTVPDTLKDVKKDASSTSSHVSFGAARGAATVPDTLKDVKTDASSRSSHVSFGAASGVDASSTTFGVSSGAASGAARISATLQTEKTDAAASISCGAEEKTTSTTDKTINDCKRKRMSDLEEAVGQFMTQYQELNTGLDENTLEKWTTMSQKIEEFYLRFGHGFLHENLQEFREAKMRVNRMAQFLVNCSESDSKFHENQAKKELVSKALEQFKFSQFELSFEAYHGSLIKFEDEYNRLPASSV